MAEHDKAYKQLRQNSPLFVPNCSKSIGAIYKKVDKNGRITVPPLWMTTLGFKESGQYYWFSAGGEIYLTGEKGFRFILSETNMIPITTKVDTINRALIPFEFRKPCKINEGDCVEAFGFSDYVIIRKAIHECAVCGCPQPEEFQRIGTEVVCDSCLKALATKCSA